MALIFEYYLLFMVLICYSNASVYRNFSVRDDAICPLHFKIPTLQVGKENFSSVIISDANYFKNWPGSISFQCSFSMKASFNLGLLAVIQNMSLRRNETTGECIDFIQFRLAKERQVSLVSLIQLKNAKDWEEQKICGDFDRSISVTNDLTLYSLNNFKGIIDVKLYVARKPLILNGTIGFEIVFTTYRDCKQSTGSYHYCDDKICIYKSLFKDGIVNCPYPRCSDEISCFILEEGGNADNELQARLTVTAVTSVFLSFFLFLGCMMLCRYCLMFRQWQQPVVVEMSGSGPTTESPPSMTAMPTAPPLTEDKDLPPAYETLFPDR